MDLQFKLLEYKAWFFFLDAKWIKHACDCDWIFFRDCFECRRRLSRVFFYLKINNLMTCFLLIVIGKSESHCILQSAFLLLLVLFQLIRLDEPYVSYLRIMVSYICKVGKLALLVFKYFHKEFVIHLIDPLRYFEYCLINLDQLVAIKPQFFMVGTFELEVYSYVVVGEHGSDVVG